MFSFLKRNMGLFALAAAALVTPFFLPNDYYLTVLIVGGLYVILTVGLNLLMGYAGQVSLGHAAFYGLSAYTSGILTATYGWPIWAGILAGLALSTSLSYLIAVPTLKLRGNYLAMGTLGFGIIMHIIFNEATITGGPSGFTGIPKLSFGGRGASDLEYYYVVWATVLVLFALSQNLVRSSMGRALRAIHTSENAASALGVDIQRYKIFVFVLSAFYASVAGVLFAHYVTVIAPSANTFGFPASVLLVTMVVLGGMGSLWGAVFGALFLTLLPEWLRAIEDFDIIVYGAILVLCMMFLPGGLVEGAQKSRDALLSLFDKKGKSTEGDGK